MCVQGTDPLQPSLCFYYRGSVAVLCCDLCCAWFGV